MAGMEITKSKNRVITTKQENKVKYFEGSKLYALLYLPLLGSIYELR